VIQMVLIVCVDDSGGMMFNGRRQSQDRILRARILRDVRGRRLWMNAYSAGQFDLDSDAVTVAEDFLARAGSGEFCFVENVPTAPYLARVESIILYRWNRKYPADFYFDIPLYEQNWRLIETEDFAGSSHEKITREVYTQ
jgi:hypothetical protein